MKTQLKRNREFVLDQLKTIQNAEVIIKNAMAFSQNTEFSFQDLVKIVHPKNFSNGQLKVQLINVFNQVGQVTHHQNRPFLAETLVQLNQLETQARKLYTRNLAGEIVETTLTTAMPKPATKQRIAKRSRVQHQQMDVCLKGIKKIKRNQNIAEYTFLFSPINSDQDYKASQDYTMKAYWNVKFNKKIEPNLAWLMEKVNTATTGVKASLKYRITSTGMRQVESVYQLH